jgi:hypothetical protein
MLFLRSLGVEVEIRVPSFVSVLHDFLEAFRLWKLEIVGALSLETGSLSVERCLRGQHIKLAFAPGVSVNMASRDPGVCLTIGFDTSQREPILNTTCTKFHSSNFFSRLLYLLRLALSDSSHNSHPTSSSSSSPSRSTPATGDDPTKPQPRNHPDDVSNAETFLSIPCSRRRPPF